MTNTNIIITGGSGFIGTNLIDYLISKGHRVMNIDISPPRSSEQAQYWQQCDIRDTNALRTLFHEFSPDCLIHLAARTDLNGKTIQDYSTNTDGVESVLKCIQNLPNLHRCIFTSSKFVCENGYIPQNDEDFCPDTVYGESKVIGEKLVRETKIKQSNTEWCIIRPTSIWGPWFSEPYLDFFMTIYRKRFFNISGLNSPRQFGYIGNAIAQIEAIMNSPAENFCKKIFYLADYDIYYIKQWAEMIANTMNHRKPYSIPYGIALLAAKAGDILKACGVNKFPLTSFRLKNMAADTSGIDLSSTKKICPNLPHSTDKGVEQTIKWLTKQNIIHLSQA